MGFVTDSVVPDGISPADVPAPMPPEVADHVASVALFGKPSTRFMHAINDPPVTIGPLYIAKTTDLCVENDLVCDPHGNSFAAHNQYIDNGTVDKGAAFAASQLQTSWAAAIQPPGATPSAPPPAELFASPHLPSAPLTAPGPGDEARSVGPVA
jgi:hypothetical protein